MKKPADILDSTIKKGHSIASSSDGFFDNDFAIRRRKLLAEATVLRILAKQGRVGMGGIQRGTDLRALPIAEAVAALAERGLVTMRRYPELRSKIPLIDLMPSVEALERVSCIIAEVAGHASVKSDARAQANIQARIDALEASDAAHTSTAH